jgi:hypothetical protein
MKIINPEAQDDPQKKNIFAPWTSDELDLLKSAYNKHEGNYKKIAEVVGTRSEDSCRKAIARYRL